MSSIPPMCEVHRRLPAAEPVNIEETLLEQWQQWALAEQVQGKRIAIGLGSRGVAEIPRIARCLVDLIKAAGGEPFVIPAMGSHGGATPHGQLDVLDGLGIREETVGCPVRATMDTVSLGQTASGLTVYTDRMGAEADGLFIINRVKIHTDFHGKHESGLMKMLAIGLGNQTGAEQLHNQGVHGIRDLMPEIAGAVIKKGNLIAGIATVEDGYHRPVKLELLPRDQIQQREPELLAYSRTMTPGLPVDDIDVLIIDTIGKDISGAGMDTNVIGRWRIAGEPEPDAPRVKSLVALDLSTASHGNATGIGLADCTVRRLLDKIDFPLLTQNVLTSGFLERGKIPLVFETDQAAIEAALMSAYRADAALRAQARVMRITDTLDLQTLWVSPALLADVQNSPGFVEAGPPQALAFKDGQLF